MEIVTVSLWYLLATVSRLYEVDRFPVPASQFFVCDQPPHGACGVQTCTTYADSHRMFRIIRRQEGKECVVEREDSYGGNFSELSANPQEHLLVHILTVRKALTTSRYDVGFSTDAQCQLSMQLALWLGAASATCQQVNP